MRRQARPGIVTHPYYARYAGWRNHGDGGVHEPRAGQGQAGGPARRYLVVRRGAGRDAHGPADVYGGETVSEILAAVLLKDPDLERSARRYAVRWCAGCCGAVWRKIHSAGCGHRRSPHRDRGSARRSARRRPGARWRRSESQPHAAVGDCGSIDAGANRHRCFALARDAAGGASAHALQRRPRGGSAARRRDPKSVLLSRTAPGWYLYRAAPMASASSPPARSIRRKRRRSRRDGKRARSLFSPDGQWIGFFADQKLKKIYVQGGAAVTVCDAPDGRGGAWGEDGNIIAALRFQGPLVRVSAAGGTPQALTQLDAQKGELTHRFPQILPGGKAVLFTAGAGGDF